MTVARLLLASLAALVTGPAAADTPVPPPVAAVADDRLALGDAQLAVFVSRDWSRPLPAVRRAVVVVHGYQRNAVDYASHVTDLGPPDDTIVIAPQYLAVEDIAAHLLPDAVLRWQRERWSDGEPAEGPAALSAFDTRTPCLSGSTTVRASPISATSWSPAFPPADNWCSAMPLSDAAHNAAKVFASRCGRAALFGGDDCPDTETPQ